jgi:hypothetical protein
MVDHGKSSSVWSVEEDAELARLQVRKKQIDFHFLAPFCRVVGFYLPPHRGIERPLVFLSRRAAPRECEHASTTQRNLYDIFLRNVHVLQPQEIHGNRWALVAAELPGKTGQQCAQRWRHKVNPNIKKEKWTPEEDAQVSDERLSRGFLLLPTTFLRWLASCVWAFRDGRSTHLPSPSSPNRQRHKMSSLGITNVRRSFEFFWVF